MKTRTPTDPRNAGQVSLNFVAESPADTPRSHAAEQCCVSCDMVRDRVPNLKATGMTASHATGRCIQTPAAHVPCYRASLLVATDSGMAIAGATEAAAYMLRK